MLHNAKLMKDAERGLSPSSKLPPAADPTRGSSNSSTCRDSEMHKRASELYLQRKDSELVEKLKVRASVAAYSLTILCILIIT